MNIRRKTIPNSSILLMLIILIPATLSCQAGQSQSAERKKVAGLVPPELTDTPLFETRVAEIQTQLAPTATLTLTPSTTPSLTPIPSLTPTITETVYKNPWVLQDECLTEIPSPCIGYSIKNTIDDAWIQVFLQSLVTGQQGSFSVPPKTTSTITLVPGPYKAIYSSACRGFFRSKTKVWDIDLRTDTFYCTSGTLEFRIK